MSNEEVPKSEPAAPEKEAAKPAPDPKPETNASLGLAIVLALALLIGMAFMWQNYEPGAELPQMVLFLGQFHPVLVHLPIALLLVVFVMEFLSVIKPWRRLRENTLFLLWISTLGAAASIIVGYMLMSTGEYSGERMENHMWAGIGVAAGSLAALMLKSGIGETLLYRFVLLLTVCTLVIAGHLGGSIAHGSNYLTEHMPVSWKSHAFFKGGGFWGFFGENGGEEMVAETPPAGGTIYDLYIDPILAEHCTECHGDAKQKGKLRLDTHVFLMMGAEGADEPTVVPGNPEESNLVFRTLLPVEDDDVMPPEDEPRLSADELLLLQWWIAEGASAEMTVAAARVDEEQTGAEILRILDELSPEDRAMKEEKVAAETAAEERRAVEAAQRAEMVAASLKKIEDRGFSIRPISAEDEGLQFNAVNVADEFDDEALLLFEPVAGDIVELDLARTKITDKGAEVLAGMSGLTRLHLENTAITDAALAKLGDLDQLEYLNLYGTKVTDAGLAHLMELESLKRVFLWQTGVTEAGVEKLKQSKSGLYVDLGWKEPPPPPAAAEEEKKEEKKPAPAPAADDKPAAKKEEPKPDAAKATEKPAEKPAEKAKTAKPAKSNGEKKGDAKPKNKPNTQPKSETPAPPKAKAKEEKPAPKPAPAKLKAA